MSDRAPSPRHGTVPIGAPGEERSLLGGIELGGTHVVCAMGTGPDALNSVEFPTTRPEETIHRCAEFFREQHDAGRLAALGVASFGPLCPDPCASDYGRITTTPKPGWAHTDVLERLRRNLGGDHPPPLTFDTDVNGAALAEGRWGAARGLHTFLYVTVGTGIGGG
ncbi:MAG: ROK family protein, partial [Myxococcota bacterium]|nr:ROK family protein [Myxococcota bacterium]